MMNNLEKIMIPSIVLEEGNYFLFTYKNYNCEIIRDRKSKTWTGKINHLNMNEKNIFNLICNQKVLQELDNKYLSMEKYRDISNGLLIFNNYVIKDFLSVEEQDFDDDKWVLVDTFSNEDQLVVESIGLCPIDIETGAAFDKKIEPYDITTHMDYVTKEEMINILKSIIDKIV